MSTDSNIFKYVISNGEEGSQFNKLYKNKATWKKAYGYPFLSKIRQGGPCISGCYRAPLIFLMYLNIALKQGI